MHTSNHVAGCLWPLQVFMHVELVWKHNKGLKKSQSLSRKLRIRVANAPVFAGPHGSRNHSQCPQILRTPSDLSCVIPDWFKTSKSKSLNYSAVWFMVAKFASGSMGLIMEGTFIHEFLNILSFFMLIIPLLQSTMTFWTGFVYKRRAESWLVVLYVKINFVMLDSQKKHESL